VRSCDATRRAYWNSCGGVGVGRALRARTSTRALSGHAAGLNLEYAYEFGRREIFLCGGYYGSDLRGMHGGFTLERGDDARKYFAVNVVGGYFYILDEDRDEVTKWGYGGFEGACHYRAFFIAPAVTLGSGKIDDLNKAGVGILGRLGFRWRL